jgi:hypothetical protein
MKQAGKRAPCSSIMAPGLMTVPDELKELIFGYIVPPSFEQGQYITDMLALRGVNKELRDYHSVPFEGIFETTSVTCHDRSLERLVRIAQHEATSQLVKKVVVSTCRLPPNDPWGRSYDRPRVGDAALESERMVVKSGMVAIQLGTAFRALQHCTCVEISEDYVCPEMRELLPNSFVFRRWNDSRTDELDAWEEWATRIMSAVAGAINNTRSCIEQFVVKASTGNRYFPQKFFNSFYDNVSFTKTFLKNLRTLELHLHSEWSSSFEPSGLAELLNSAAGLEYLALKISSSGHRFSNEDLTDALLTTVFQSATVPRLRALVLEGGVTMSAKLVPFLLKHKTSLRLLEMRNVCVINEPFSWIQILMQLAGSFALEKLAVESTWSTDHNIAIVWGGDNEAWKPRRFRMLLEGDVDQQLRHATQSFTIKPRL